MTSDGKNCYTYNDANQLSQVKDCGNNQVIAEYVYDYQGNRIEKKIYNSGSVQKTVYSPSKEYETVTLASNGATTNTSYYKVNDTVVAKKNPDGSKNYYLSDNLGSTNVLTNQSGSVIENSTYYPFGQIRSGGTKSKQLYTGQENDSETDLDYYNSRYYNPAMKHFTQPDTVLPDIYDPQQLNRYSYVRNNPMTVTDPSGHSLISFVLQSVLLLMVMFTPVIMSHNNVHPAQAVHSITNVVATATNNTSHNVQKVENQAKTAGSSVVSTVQSAIGNIQHSNKPKKGNDNSGSDESDNGRSDPEEINFRSNQKLSTEERLQRHFNDHGSSMGYNTPQEYLNGARELYKGGDGVEALVRPNGDELYYRPTTNEYLSVDKSGVIRTFMAPEPLDYWADDISNYTK